MKKLIAILTVSITVCAHAEDIKLPHVSVFGTAEIKVVPDEMTWSLVVETKGKDVGLVAQLHDQKVGVVLKFLKEQKIEEKEIQTSRIQLSENWVYRDRNRVKEGYAASTHITFKSSDLEKYRPLWLGVANLPDVSVKGVSFGASERIKYQNDSRVEAVKVAREKAGALAEALGSSIYEPLLIEENVASGSNPFSNSGGLRSNRIEMPVFNGANGPSVAPGTISVKTSVQVKFRISSN